jgi:glucose/arabinose dehydrogenase
MMKFRAPMRALSAQLLLAVVLAALAISTGASSLRTSQSPEVEVVASGLATIWAIDFAPDGRIFLTERAGRIRVIQDGALLAQPWMVLDDVVEISEAGLLGLALDPGFASNGYVYAAYTYRAASGALANKLVRLREDPVSRSGVFDAVVLDGIRGANNHDGGRVKFGPDGHLYWTMGETGDRPLSQDPGSWNGKILRLAPDGSIPDYGPYPGSPVYSIGHRNPQGLAWHPVTGDLFITEHGPSGQETCCDEVNRIFPGANYGWPQSFGEQVADGTIAPVIQSGRTTWAPGGAAFVTRGPWAGSLVFTGLRGQSLYRLVLDDANPGHYQNFETHFSGSFGRLRDVVEGPDGALYVATSNRDGRGSPGASDDRLLRLVFR